MIPNQIEPLTCQTWCSYVGLLGEVLSCVCVCVGGGGGGEGGVARIN